MNQPLILAKGIMLCIMVLFANTQYASAGDLNPGTAPAPTMKTLQEVQPRNLISTVPCTITQSGSYYFTDDLVSTGTGITG